MQLTMVDSKVYNVITSTSLTTRCYIYNATPTQMSNLKLINSKICNSLNCNSVYLAPGVAAGRMEVEDWWVCPSTPTNPEEGEGERGCCRDLVPGKGFRAFIEL